ncbi:hypothetical protein D3C84_746750 [compost metagenome]
MFLPMSCTSPLTVAMRILPLASGLSPFSASMKGIRWATACFITRADLTTWGRNILPEPNRSPTTFMPAISGPSMTSMGRAHCWRNSSVSSTMWVVMPLTSACLSRSTTSQPRHSSVSASLTLPSPLYWSAIASKASVPFGVRLSTTSSTASRSCLGISS